MSSETLEIRHKRIRMRAWHRGMKEMDFILGQFTDARLADLSVAQLDTLEAMMEENDQDLYKWVSGQSAPLPQFAEMIATIRAHIDAR